MLNLIILISTAIAVFQTQTSENYKRSPGKTFSAPIATQSVSPELPEQMDTTHAIDAPEIPASKRQRTNPPHTAKAIGELQRTAQPTAVYAVTSYPASNVSKYSGTKSTHTASQSASPRHTKAKNNNFNPNMTDFKLMRNLTTVNQVWQEYKYGINGSPSVESVVTRYGTNWRKSRTEWVYYSKRKKIYGHITQALKKGKSEDEAVNELEAVRVTQGWSLAKLQDNLKSLDVDKETGKLKPAVSIYLLNRNLTTVPQVWQEYKYGIKGNPSVENLDAQYGKSWLKSRVEYIYYYKRDKIYNFIKESAKRGKKEEETVNELERLRIEQGWTLSQLQDNIMALSIDESSGELEAPSEVYLLLRNLTTVPQVWQEYKYGINGNPSIETFVESDGIKWMHSDSERSYYYGRKKIYDFIKTSIKDGFLENDVVTELEKSRLQKEWNLGTLQHNIASLSLDKESRQLKQIKVTYKMMRNLTTVPDVWQEYKNGMNGNPSVESLVQASGIGWLESIGDRHFYYQRRRIYNYINSEHQKGNPENDTVNELETLREANKWSIGELQTHLSAKSLANGSANEFSYRLSQHLTSVPEVWQEYTIGLDGNPSVESLVEEHGLSWLRSKSDKAAFYRRRRIYDYINNRIESGQSEEAAVNELEEMRRNNNWSLYQIQEHFKEQPGGKFQQGPSPLKTEDRIEPPLETPDVGWSSIQPLDYENEALFDNLDDTELRLEPALEGDDVSLFPDLSF